jgi:hypothetical protein
MASEAFVQRLGSAAGAACKTFMPRETGMAAPVSFIRWFCGLRQSLGAQLLAAGDKPLYQSAHFRMLCAGRE